MIFYSELSPKNKDILRFFQKKRGYDTIISEPRRC